jgi:hypothetical protein
MAPTHHPTVSKNDFHLDLPTHLGIHDVVNVDLLKPYHESTLETKILTNHPVDIVPYFLLLESL